MSQMRRDVSLCEVLVAHEEVWLEHLYLNGGTLAQLGSVCRTLHAWHHGEKLWEKVCNCHYSPKLLEGRLLNRRTANELDRQYPVRCTWSSSPGVVVDEHGLRVRGVGDSVDGWSWIVGAPLSPGRNRIRLQVSKYDKEDGYIFLGVGTTIFAATLKKYFKEDHHVHPALDDRFATHAAWFTSTGYRSHPKRKTSPLARSYNLHGFDQNDVLDITLLSPTQSGVQISFHINGTRVYRSDLRTLERGTSISDLRPVFRVPDTAELIFLPLSASIISEDSSGQLNAYSSGQLDTTVR